MTTYLTPPGATALDHTTVGEAMHGPDESLRGAAQLMREHSTTHLIVVDTREHPIGVVSTLDVAAFLAGSRLPVERSSR
jgi:CBS domain-containing protein